MRANARRRQVLLSTAAFLGVLTGYGNRAYAQCAPATTPSGPVVTCSGGPFNTPVTVDNTGNANESLAVSTTAAFQVNVIGPNETALTITGNGAVSFVDPYSGSYFVSDNGTGLSITSTGDITTPTYVDGSVYVKSQGKFYGGNGDGIYAYNNGGGTTDIRVYGLYVEGDARGIFATTGGSDVTVITGASTAVEGGDEGISIEQYGAGKIDITANGSVKGGGEGAIYAINSGTNSTSITANGEVTGTSYFGIHAYNGATAKDIAVTTGTASNVTGDDYAINVENYGTGNTTVTANGEAYGFYHAIRAITGTGGGDLTVTTGSSSKLTSDLSTIYTYNSGAGSTAITANGEVTSSGTDGTSFGIYAVNDTTAKNLSVTTGAGSNVSGYYTGVRVLNQGGGYTKIDLNGTVSQTRGTFGDVVIIGSYANTTSLNVTVGTGGNVTGTGNGIITRHYGSGATSIEVNGAVTGRDYDAIYATNYGTALNVTTGTGSTVKGGFNGINANNSGGSGAIDIEVNGSVIGGKYDGIYALGNGSSPIRITVGSSGSVRTTAGGFAINAYGGSGNVTVAGTVGKGTYGSILFDQGSAFKDRLEIQPTAAIAGNVFAGPGMDTLAFGGTGTGTFNLSKIDTQFQSFERFRQESATWSFSGTTTHNFTVSGGTLKGTGTFGGLNLTGGTLAPGNSIGTMRVNGAFKLGSNAVYEVEVNGSGKGDKVIVKGTVNLTGATLSVLAANGNYKTKTNYTIIDNDGTDAVVGRFGSVSVDLAFLTPTVFYNGGTGNDVVLSLARNGAEFADVARTPNQRAVAGALSKFPASNALFRSVLNQTDDGARQAFDALSGEVHATVAGTLVDDSRYVREAVMGRMMQAGHSGEALAAAGPQMATYSGGAMMLGQDSDLYDGKHLLDAPEAVPLAFWTRAYGAWGDFEGDGNAATTTRDLGGFISGVDAEVSGSWRVGLATGASFSNVNVDARYSGADVNSYHLGGYVGGMAGEFAMRGGGMWTWNEIETSRAVVFPGFFERQKANYDADTGQLFGEIAYPTQVADIGVEPFAGLAFVSVDTESFKEKGGPQASLRGVKLDQDVGYTTVGVRAAKTMMWGTTEITPHLSAAWLHAFDDVTPGASFAFATTGVGFDIAGVPLAEDSALLDAGLDLAVSDRITAGVSYSGQYADDVSDNAVKGRLTWLFN